MGGFVACRADGVAGAARCRRMRGVAQQIQRAGSLFFGIQQHPHTEGRIQLLPAGLAAQIGQAVVIVGAFLLPLLHVLEQRVKAVAARLFLPVPAKQAAADLVASGLDLKRDLQRFIGHKMIPFFFNAEHLLCPTSPSMLRIATSPCRRGLGSPQKTYSFCQWLPFVGKTPSGRREMSRERQREGGCHRR